MRSRAADTASVVTADAPSEAIALTDKAVDHIKKLRQESGSGNLLLRVGVKQGGCSGMSYVMDFEKEENLKVCEAAVPMLCSAYRRTSRAFVMKGSCSKPLVST